MTCMVRKSCKVGFRGRIPGMTLSVMGSSRATRKYFLLLSKAHVTLAVSLKRKSGIRNRRRMGKPVGVDFSYGEMFNVLK